MRPRSANSSFAFSPTTSCFSPEPHEPFNRARPGQITASVVPRLRLGRRTGLHTRPPSRWSRCLRMQQIRCRGSDMQPRHLGGAQCAPWTPRDVSGQRSGVRDTIARRLASPARSTHLRWPTGLSSTTTGLVPFRCTAGQGNRTAARSHARVCPPPARRPPRPPGAPSFQADSRRSGQSATRQADGAMSGEDAHKDKRLEHVP